MTTPQNNDKRTAARWHAYRQSIQELMDPYDLYREMGVEFATENPNTDGWIKVFGHPAIGEVDEHPSCAINVQSGIYHDFRTNKSLGIYDFMVAVGQAEDWRDAQKKVAEKYEVQLPKKSRRSPEHGVQWAEWNDTLAKQYCRNKPPCTIEGLIRSGAQMCTLHGDPAFAWPIYDDMLNCIGYYFLRRNGEPFERDSGPAKSIYKVDPGADYGFIGTPAVRAMLADRHPELQEAYEQVGWSQIRRPLIWCEGGPDMVAAYSVYPESCEFFTNPGGAGQNASKTQANMLAHSPGVVLLMTDADHPGIAGATKKKEQMEKMLAGRHLIFRVWSVWPESEVQPKHGKDLRDFLGGNPPAEDFQYGLHEYAGFRWKTAAYVYSTVDPKDSNFAGSPLCHLESQEVKEKIDQDIERFHEKEIETKKKDYRGLLEKVGVQLYMVYPDGSFVIGSNSTGHSKLIKNMSSMKYIDYAQVMGDSFMEHVKPDADTDEKGEPFTVFQKAIASLKTSVSTMNLQVVGNGFWWAGEDDDQELILVNGNQFYRYMDEKFDVKEGPTYRGMIIDYENRATWFNPSKLQEYVDLAQDRAWREEILDTVSQYASTWVWQHEDQPYVAAGLLYATFLQTLLEWRPLILLTGESESGKSQFLEMVDDLYGRISPRWGAGTTVPGLMQHVKYSALPVLIDELDKNRNEKSIVEQYRGSGNQLRHAKGTPSGAGRDYRTRHMPWLCGITYSSDEMADINRMVNLQFEKPTTGERTLRRPPAKEWRHLSYGILASSVVIAQEAVDMASELTARGEHLRQRESHAVPFACLAAVRGLGLDDAGAILDDYIEEYVKPGIVADDVQTDHMEALSDLLDARIRLPYDAPVSEVTISTIISDSSQYAAFEKHIEEKGVAIKETRYGLYVVFCSRLLCQNDGPLGRHPKWGKAKVLHRHLRLIKEPEFNYRSYNIAGRMRHCYAVKFEDIRNWMKKDE